MKKIVINSCYGGFGLSKLALEQYAQLTGIDPNTLHADDIPRDDEHLVAIVEKLDIKANGTYAKLKVVPIPDNVQWQVEEYDGREWIAEVHRTWN